MCHNGAKNECNKNVNQWDFVYINWFYIEPVIFLKELFDYYCKIGFYTFLASSKKAKSLSGRFSKILSLNINSAKIRFVKQYLTLVVTASLLSRHSQLSACCFLFHYLQTLYYGPEEQIMYTLLQCHYKQSKQVKLCTPEGAKLFGHGSRGRGWIGGFCPAWKTGFLFACAGRGWMFEVATGWATLWKLYDKLRIRCHLFFFGVFDRNSYRAKKIEGPNYGVLYFLDLRFCLHDAYCPDFQQLFR